MSVVVASRAPRVLASLTLALLAATVTPIALRPVGSGDTFWMIRNGRSILDTRHLPMVDSYSYTVAGTPWNDHEWLFEAGLALLHRVAGWDGVRASVLLLFGTALALTVRIASRGASLGLSALVTTCVAGFASYKLVPAPQTACMALVLAGSASFFGERLVTSTPRRIALLVGMLIAGNLTAESLSFLPLLAADQLPRLRNLPSPERRRHLLVLALAAVLPLVNPDGASSLEYALMRGQEANSEFAPLFAPATIVSGTSKAIARGVVILFVIYLVRAVALRRVRPLPVPELAVALVACAQASAFERSLYLLVFPASLVASACEAALPASRRAWLELGSIVVGAALLLAPPAVLAWRADVGLAALASPAFRATAIDPTENPVECRAILRALPEGTRLFTPFAWSSYVLYRAPQVRIFVDGRNREYPAAVREASVVIAEGRSGARELLDRSRTDAVLAPTGWERSPGIGGAWAPIAATPRCALHTRRPTHR